MAKIELLGDRVLLQRYLMDEKTEGGIYLPDESRLKTQIAHVVEVSPEVKKVKKDDVVLVGKYTGIDVEIDKTEFTIAHEEDIIGRLIKK